MSFTRTASGSSIASIKRDWSDDAPAQHVPGTVPARAAPTAGEKAARVARRIAMMEGAMIKSGTSHGVKRMSDGASGLEPPAKRAGLSEASNTTTIVTAGDATAAKPATISVAAQIVLSGEQQEILKLVTAGKNIFFTGSAGTGKSVLLREILRSLRKKYQRSPDAVAVTASTGMAACNIGGITLHSFAGIGLGYASPEELALKIRKVKKTYGRWLRTQVLIVDEISMVDAELFDKLARVACLLRKSTKPFGGIQLVVCGDFFQLPPVSKNNQAKFAFEATMWGDCVERTFNLTKVFRQKEQIFIDMLNEMRYGTLTNANFERFRRLSRPIDTSDGIEPTELFPMREQVEFSNRNRMKNLEGKVHTYKATDGGQAEGEQLAKLLQNMMAPYELPLKINTQVMLIKNTDETLVNGSVGKVVDFVDQTTYNQRLMGSLEEEQPVDKKNSKKKDPGPPPGAQVYPLVKFAIPGGSREILIAPETWKVELPNGQVQASRTQLPLILAWAMSIHKSQGQTLPRVKVDLSKVFEKGQAYVALSRATSLEGLQVIGFEKKHVQAHPKVVEWSKTLETIN